MAFFLLHQSAHRWSGSFLGISSAHDETWRMPRGNVIRGVYEPTTFVVNQDSIPDDRLF